MQAQGAKAFFFFWLLFDFNLHSKSGKPLKSVKQWGTQSDVPLKKEHNYAFLVLQGDQSRFSNLSRVDI